MTMLINRETLVAVVLVPLNIYIYMHTHMSIYFSLYTHRDNV